MIQAGSNTKITYKSSDKRDIKSRPKLSYFLFILWSRFSCIIQVMIHLGKLTSSNICQFQVINLLIVLWIITLWSIECDILWLVPWVLWSWIQQCCKMLILGGLELQWGKHGRQKLGVDPSNWIKMRHQSRQITGLVAVSRLVSCHTHQNWEAEICMRIPAGRNSPQTQGPDQKRNGLLTCMLFSDAFSWMKSFVFWLKFHWCLFLRVKLTISQHWFR